MNGYHLPKSAWRLFESEVNAGRQRLLMIEDKRRAQQISLDKPTELASRASLPRPRGASLPGKATCAMWKAISLS
jgi:hypothetical protein